MRLPLIRSVRVHNLIPEDLLTLNYRRQLLRVNPQILHRPVTRRQVEVDAQVPPELSDMLDGLRSSDLLLGYGPIRYLLLLFAIDKDNNTSIFRMIFTQFKLDFHVVCECVLDSKG